MSSKRRPSSRPAALWLPGVFALIATSLLIYGNVARLSPLALGLATATLIAASLRLVTLLMAWSSGRERAAPAAWRAHHELEARVAERTAALERLSRQNKSILESAGEGIWGIDREGRMVFANKTAADLTGYSVGELLARRLHELLHHTRRDGTPYPTEDCPVDRSLRDGTVHQVSDELYFRKNGTSFPVEYTSTPIWEDGEVRGAVVVFKDVTERSRTERERAELERRLQRSQRMESVGQLAGGIAHDFNNLLAVILNYASFVREELPDDDPVRQDVEEIYGAAERAAALTRQLLLFSRRDVRKAEVLDLNTVVADMKRLLERTIGEHVELRTRFAPELPPVVADRSQLEQVVLNLAVNARDAMPAGGTLTIETDDLDPRASAAGETGHCVALRVADTGLGMQSEVAARAFEPFFSTKPKDLGSGLGLATVYGIVAGAGGQIELDSEPGRGTVVEVTLPAVEREVKPRPARRRADPPRSAPGEETILLVEDEHAVRELTRRILCRHRHEVLTAGSPSEALHVLANHEWPVDLLVTDVVLPEMSGKELAERMRELQPGLPVLYVSGYDDEIVARHGVLESHTPLLQKPFDTHALLARVREALDGPAGSKPITQ